nr:hypothetical protein CFP56_30679 [Quercus suber]
MVRTGMAPTKQRALQVTTTSKTSQPPTSTELPGRLADTSEPSGHTSEIVPIASTTTGLGTLGGKAPVKQTVVVHKPSGPVYEPASGKCKRQWDAGVVPRAALLSSQPHGQPLRSIAWSAASQARKAQRRATFPPKNDRNCDREWFLVTLNS